MYKVYYKHNNRTDKKESNQENNGRDCKSLRNKQKHDTDIFPSKRSLNNKTNAKRKHQARENSQNISAYHLKTVRFFVVNNSVSALVNNGRNANNDINGNKHQTDKARNAGSDRLKAQRISKRNERILPADHSIRALNAHTRKEY